MTPNGASGRRPDGAAFIIALGLVALGALLVWDGGRIPDKAGYSGVGPGDVPKLIGYALVLLGIGTAIEGWRNPGPKRPKQHPVPLLWLLGGMVVMVASIHTIGFVLGSTILFTCAAAAFGERRFHVAIPSGLGLGLFIYAVFDVLLQLNLPGGPIEMAIFGR
ncbi:MAG: tripartite tricarboxylate transporter TctB family protein [Rhodobacteraceae bacterium]|jgi:putative tricarboxylic transport membrane protein|nr:tripartite tricarboxylate transporter TctB family protein [Paracoccaceae bacterium]